MANQNDIESRSLAKYEDIIRRFISGDISAPKFESEYLSAFKSKETHLRPNDFHLLDSLFADVDDYVSDPQLRADAGGLDDEQLRQRATATYDRLFGAKEPE
ncbi:colicin immunity domain-containing protein [Nocardia sp. NPDC046473]|uniref:colicin immunity domain-containing protein n=1 Tax=Nocardia sp. NPDC046473 TaxID=3155733 RepID=UPI0033D18855